MATLTFVKSECFVEAVCEKNHNLASDTLKLCLMDVAPVAATDTNYTTHWASTKEIDTGNGYTTTGEAITVTSSSQTSGTYSLVIADDVSWTASVGAMAGFRYVGLYNSTATGANCIGYWDHGSTITLGVGETYLADIGGTTLITLA